MLQATLSNAADAIVATEESWIRALLLRAESKLELLRFTVDSDRIFQQSLVVISDVERALSGERHANGKGPIADS